MPAIHWYKFMILGELALAIDVNETITDTPDWIALEGRLSKSIYKGLEFGGGLGPHIPLNGSEGISTHSSLDLTIRF